MKAYLIPGAFEDVKSRGYRALLDTYKELGYQPEFVRIDWKYKTIDDWVEQVKSEIPKENVQSSLLSGFSWGSMIALAVAAEHTNPKKLLLFSLSPYFAEDLPHVKKPWFRWAGKNRISTFKNFYMNELADKIDCPTVIFIGSKEVSKYSDMRRRTREAHKRIKGSRLVIIDGVKHDVADPKYVAAIKETLKNT
ncbi:MAG TPA: alpha/beta hydrolase [Candidatus Nitrosopolaris sp.]|nr:alpha/beta hydrolase [Candidatus Nitrosopolaris sp.]